MKFDRLTHQLRYFGTGVIDQVLLSGASFVAGFVMIRFTTDLDYGQFVLAQSALLLLITAQGAWLSGPVTATAPKKPPELKRLMIGSLQASQTRLLHRLALCLLVVVAGGYVIGAWGASAAAVAGVTTIAGWAALQREYLRNVLLIYSRAEWMLLADIIYAVIFMSGVGLAAYFHHSAGVWAIVAVIAASWVGAKVAHRMLASDPGWATGESGAFWKEIRPLGQWAAVGGVIYWLFAQSYNFVLAQRLDLKAVADVNAARLLLMPVFVFTLGVNNLLMPVAANWLAEFDVAITLRRLGMLTLAIAAIDFVYFALAWNYRDWLVGDLLHKTIHDSDRLLLLWAGIAVIFLLREVLQAILFAMRQVKLMAWLMGLSAIISLTLMWSGIAWWGAAAVLIGQIAGECVNLAGLALLIWMQLKSKTSSGISTPS